jgi:hypothetical protein
MHIKHLVTILDNSKVSSFGYVWGQCSSILHEMIKADDEFNTKSKDFDCIWLLTNKQRW